MSDQPFAQDGYDLMGSAFEVHGEIGGDLLEEIYQECFEIELGLRQMPFVAKDQLRCFYKGNELKKRYIPDLIVHSMIVVELKAVSKLTSEHEAQLMNYMRLSRKPVGYLINFAPIDKVEWKRFVLKEFVT